MPTFTLKGKIFDLPPAYAEGHLPTAAEAQVLNALIAKHLRENIIAGRVKTRAEAETFVRSDAAFGAPETLEELEDL